MMNVPEVALSSLISAAELGIIAVGLTMTFSILRFANFSHAPMAVVGAYMAYIFNVNLGLPLLVAFVPATVVMGLFGVATELGIFRFLRNTGDLTPMIASLGLALAIQYSVQSIWGPQFLRFNYPLEPGILVFGAHITVPEIGIIIMAAAALIGFISPPWVRRCARQRPTPAWPPPRASIPTA